MIGLGWAKTELKGQIARLRPAYADLRHCVRHIQPGSIVIDVGGHHGIYAAAMRHRVGRNGRVVVIEPNPISARDLRLALGSRRCEVHQCAASDRSGTGVLHVPHGAAGPVTGLGRLESRGPDGDEYAVDLVPLDELLGHLLSNTLDNTRGNTPSNTQGNTLDNTPGNTQGDTGRICLMKIDVEGHELEAVTGARALITEHRPVIVCEIEQRHLTAGRCLEAVVDGIAQMGYQPHVICGSTTKPFAEFDLHEDQLAWLDGRGELSGAWIGRYLNSFIFFPIGAARAR